MNTYISRALALAFAMAAALPAAAQYTDQATVSNLGGPQEFARRRQELAKQVKAGTVVLFARIHDPEANHYREDNDFFYYTGLADPGAVMVMDAEKGTTFILEPQQAPRMKQVYGANLLSKSEDEQKKWGFARVMPVSGTLPSFL